MKVSIILPVYNVERYLRACLDSISRQTFRDFEVIAVDDGSTDASGEILDNYQADFPLRRIHQSNQGLSGARNAAMDVATGEYLLMVDSDDRIHPRILELTVRAAESARLDFVLFDYRRVPETEMDWLMRDWSEDRDEPQPRLLPVPAFDAFIRVRSKPVAWQMLYRRASLSGRRFVPGILYEDVPFVLTYLAGPVRGAWLNKELYCYAVTRGSITAQTDYRRRMAGYEAGLRILRDELDPVRYRDFVRRNFTRWLRDLWRSVHRLRPDGGRAEQMLALRRLLRRILSDGLVRWGDFALPWRLRYALSVLRAGRGPS